MKQAIFLKTYTSLFFNPRNESDIDMIPYFVALVKLTLKFYIHLFMNKIIDRGIRLCYDDSKRGEDGYMTELLMELREKGIFPAHIHLDDSAVRIQSLRDHCEEAAKIAGDILCPIGLGNTARLAGMLHDIGKETDQYRTYLVNAVTGNSVKPGSVNHSFAGVRLVLKHLCTESMDSMSKIAAQHIAFSIGAHHGLFDILNPEGENGFDHRLSKDDPIIAEGVKGFLMQHDIQMLQAQLQESGREIESFYGKISNKKEISFYSHLISRMLLSAVIEGDRRSTAEFEHPREIKPVQADQELWAECLSHLEKELQGFVKTSDVARGRGIFSDKCREFAQKPGGIYRLNMPTGAGKTLSSLRYALAHSQKWSKQRIFFVMPLLAIIDQNADILKQYLGREDIVLEHHSNLLPTEDQEELDKRELLMENWNAPVVITTLVQLLNTMFSHKTTAIRRFHSLCNSVIVLDEVQTVPTKLLSLFNQAISFLSEVCGATIILCSATQPALESTQHPLHFVPEDMIPYEEKLWKPFQRTLIHPLPSMALGEIAEFAAEQLTEKRSLLIICNKKAQAAQLYQLLENQDAACFHFSASMCMAHRRNILAQMEAAKETGKVLCVSTQVMEAGVDISFQCVIRLMAGMDSVIQSAGRCNRNGESDRAEDVYVIPCIGEDLRKLTEIKDGKEAARALFAHPMEDYSSSEAIHNYYQIYYGNQAKNYQDFYCDKLRRTLYGLLSENQESLRRDSPYFLNQAYKTAALHFQVFDEYTVDAAVQYGDSDRLIQRLDAELKVGNYAEADKILEALKPYTISLYQYQREILEKQGALTVGPNGILVLGADWYDEILGLILQADLTFLEV